MKHLIKPMLNHLNSQYATVKFIVKDHYAYIRLDGEGWDSQCEPYHHNPFILGALTFWELMLMQLNRAILRFPDLEELHSLRWDVIALIDEYKPKQKGRKRRSKHNEKV